MAKLILDDLVNLEDQPGAVSLINDNSVFIEAALENTLSRDGSSPNQMLASLDMNSNRILNLPDAVNDSEPITLRQLEDAAELSLTIASNAIFSSRAAFAGASTPGGLAIGDYAETTGYASAGDGGGARYQKISPTDATYLSMPSNPGYVLTADGSVFRIVGPVLNIRSFGATSDTNVDGSNPCGAAVNLCIQFYNANSNYTTIYFPADGIWTMDRAATPFTRVWRIAGDINNTLAPSAVFKAYVEASPTKGMFSSTNHLGTVENIQIKGISGSGGSAISVIMDGTSSSISNLRMKDVTISMVNLSDTANTCNYALYLDGSLNTNAPIGIRNIFMRNCQFFGATLATCNFNSVRVMEAVGTIMDTSGSHSSGGCVNFLGTSAVRCNAVTMEGRFNGITFEYTQDVVIYGTSGNTVFNEHADRTSIYGDILGDLSNVAGATNNRIYGHVTGTTQTNWDSSNVVFDTLSSTISFPLTGPSGSAGAPTYTFSTDTDTGIYNPSADILGIAAGGTLAAQVDAFGALTLPLTSGGISSAGTTDASSSSSASAVFTGGLAVGKKIYTGDVIRAATGSNSAPTYSFTAETNSGWYRLSAGTLAIAIGGTAYSTFTSGVASFLQQRMDIGASGDAVHFININGANSGTGSGSFIQGANGGSSVWILGSSSAIRGGAYDDTTRLQYSSALKLSRSTTDVLTFDSSNLTSFLTTTEASAYNTAAVTFAGGVGVAKKAYLHSNLLVEDNTVIGGTSIDTNIRFEVLNTSTTQSTGTFYNRASLGYVGSVLNTYVDQAAGSGFNFFKAISDVDGTPTTQFYVRGDGFANSTLGFGLGGNLFALASGDYHAIYNPSNTSSLLLGDVIDPTNYYQNTAHVFRDRAGTTNYWTIDNIGRFYQQQSGSVYTGTSGATITLTDVFTCPFVGGIDGDFISGLGIDVDYNGASSYYLMNTNSTYTIAHNKARTCSVWGVAKAMNDASCAWGVAGVGYSDTQNAQAFGAEFNACINSTVGLGTVCPNTTCLVLGTGLSGGGTGGSPGAYFRTASNATNCQAKFGWIVDDASWSPLLSSGSIITTGYNSGLYGGSANLSVANCFDFRSTAVSSYVLVHGTGVNPITYITGAGQIAALRTQGFAFTDGAGSAAPLVDYSASLNRYYSPDGTIHFHIGDTQLFSDATTHNWRDNTGANTFATLTSSGFALGTTVPLKFGTVSFLPLVNFASLPSVNFNSANSDTAVTIPIPPGYTRYRVTAITISGASATMGTATFGLFTSTGGGGTALLTGQATTISSTSESTNGNAQVATVPNANTMSFTNATLQFRVQTAQGTACTANVVIQFAFLP